MTCVIEHYNHVIEYYAAETSKYIETFCVFHREKYYIWVCGSVSETKIILWEFMFTFTYMHNFYERNR